MLGVDEVKDYLGLDLMDQSEDANIKLAILAAYDYFAIDAS